MPLRPLFLLIALAIGGCAALPHNRIPTNALDDPDLHAALSDLLCRVASDCSHLRLHVLDRDSTQAEIFPDGRLLIHLGLLLATRGEGEIAFVLAHEHAHRQLRHVLARSPSERTRIEIEADTEAVQVLAGSGFDPAAGRALLERLLAEARSGETTPEPQAVAQMLARIAALPVAPEGAPAVPAQADAAWGRRLAPYRSRIESIRGDAPASLPPPSPPADP